MKWTSPVFCRYVLHDMVRKKGESGISDDLLMNAVVYKTCKVEIVKNNTRDCNTRPLIIQR